MDYIVFAIPVFFLLIGIELLIQKIGKADLYRFNDAIANINCGITQQVTTALVRSSIFVGYKFLYDLKILNEIPIAWWSVILLFLGVDLLYYWFHRYSHEINFLWGAHIVHHQSEEYNLSVALRQSAIQNFFSSVFYLPLAVVGFDPVTFVIVNQFQTLYQFWIHTRTIGKMPAWFEFVMNTPSHHRVHHGRNPKYIDRNHGGTLIIWDRIFGSFQAEEEEVIYGVTKPLKSWNSIWANLDYYRDLLESVWQTSKWTDKILLLVKRPGWQPSDKGGMVSPPEIDARVARKFETSIPVGLNYYLLFQFLILLSGAALFLFNSKQLLASDPVLAVLAALSIFFAVQNLGGIFQLKTWALPLEVIRIIALVLLVWMLTANKDHATIAIAGMCIYTVVSFVWLGTYIRRFGKQNESLIPIHRKVDS